MPRYGSIVSPNEDWYVQREIPNEEEMSVVPDAPAPPSLTKEYIERELNFLPEAFRRSMYRRSIHLRSGKIIRYLIDTYGYIPPRINRLVTGSYHSHRDTPPPPPPPPQPQYMDTAAAAAATAAAAASNHQRIDNANQAALEAEVATRVLNSALQSVVNSLSPIASPSLQQQQQQHQQSPLLDFNALMSDPPSVLPRLDDVSPPSMTDNNVIDNIFDEINREAAALRHTPPPPPTPPPTSPQGRYVKRMTVPRKSMTTTTTNSSSSSSSSSSGSSDEDDDNETPRSKIKSILNNYCKNKFNTKTTAHKIIDIANSVVKNNIR